MYILGYTDAQSDYQFMKMRRILHGATEYYQWSCQRGHRSRLNLYKFHVYKKLVRNIHAFRRIWMDEDVTDWRKYSILLLLPTVSNKLQRQFCQSLRLFLSGKWNQYFKYSRALCTVISQHEMSAHLATHTDLLRKWSDIHKSHQTSQHQITWELWRYF